VRVSVQSARKLQVVRLLVVVCLFPGLSARVDFQESALALLFVQALVEV
jgi:hypothetical protein